MRETKRLPESELDIMLAIWKKPGPATAPAILEALERPLTASALHSYLKRLEERGFLSCEKAGKINHYTALVTKRDYQKQEGKALLDQLYGKSLTGFAAAMYEGGRLDKTEVEELREFLKEVEWSL